MGNQSPHLQIHGLGHGGINFHLPLLVALVFVAQCRPVARGAHAHHGRVTRDDSQGSRTFTPLFTQHVPALLVLAAVLVNQRLRGLNGHMVGLKAQVSKKGLGVGLVGLEVVDHAIDKIG